MSCEIIVRYARNEDLQQRMELVRNGLSTYFWDAFIYFFFQELTLECCVLSGAVLFIFLGVSLPACLALLPAAAALVALAVVCTHHALAHKQAQSIRKEMFGLVAEVKGRLLMTPGTDPILISIQLNQDKDTSFSQVMGTVSVSDFWGPENNGWLHAMVVHPQWRGRGAGRALAGAARRAAAARGLAALGAAASALQGAARAALLAAGWRCLGAHERPLLGAALALPVLRLTLDLPQP
ncbi:unnamed protein product, partial [Brenthis ino]